MQGNISGLYEAFKAKDACFDGRFSANGCRNKKGAAGLYA